MGSFSVRLKCRFSAPACMISPRRAERRSRLAKGHRRRRREAVWTAASTARRLIRSGLPPCHYPFRGVLVAETSAFENLVSHPAKDLTAGRKSNALVICICRPLFIFEVNCITENSLPGSLRGVMTCVDAVKRFMGYLQQAG
jgi:hypothetical protein